MPWYDSLRDTFSFLFTRPRREQAVVQYVLREHHRGRSLTEILQDNYVTNRCSTDEIDRLLENPELVHALGEDIVSSARATR